MLDSLPTHSPNSPPCPSQSPTAAKPEAKTAGKAFETLALLYATALKKDPKFTVDFKLMSALTFGERSDSALQWEFRAVKKRVKEIVDESERREASGEVLKAVQYSKGQAPPAAKRARTKDGSAEDEDAQEEETNAKGKKPAKPRAKRAKKNDGAVKSPGHDVSTEDDAVKGEDENDGS